MMPWSGLRSLVQSWRWRWPSSRRCAADRLPRQTRVTTWPNRTTRRSRRSRTRFVTATAWLCLPLSLLHVTACGMRASSTTPRIVIIEESSIQPGTETGTWVVTDGWLLETLDTIHQIERRLAVCESSAGSECPSCED